MRIDRIESNQNKVCAMSCTTTDLTRSQVSPNLIHEGFGDVATLVRLTKRNSSTTAAVAFWIQYYSPLLDSDAALDEDVSQNERGSHASELR